MPARSLSTNMYGDALAMAAAPDNPGVEAALDWAEVAAMLGDYAEALSWLDYIESYEGALAPELADRRRAWIRQAHAAADAAEA